MSRRDDTTGDLFAVPQPAAPLPGSMDYRASLSHLLGEMLRNAGMDRQDVAHAASKLTGYPVSKHMLDGYRRRRTTAGATRLGAAMSSGSFSLKWEDQGVQRSLAKLVESGIRLRPLMMEIGQELVRSTLQRFEDEVDPDGNSWVELKEATKARKRGSKKLVERGYLKGGIAMLKATDEFVEIGPDREYAAIHQFGGTADMPPAASSVPARPFVGVGTSDYAEIALSVAEFLRM